MTRKTDLEQHIRKSYELICEFEEILQLSSDPKEQARSHRGIQEQRGFIKDYLAEYVPLCEHLGLTMPEDITEIAVTTGVSLPSLLPPEPDPALSTAGPDAPQLPPPDLAPPLPANHALSEPDSSLLKRLKDFFEHYLWSQLLSLFLFLVGVIEGLVGVFDIPPCPRRLVLTILTVLGGGAILGLSFLSRYRNHYQVWDRWLTSGLLHVMLREQNRRHSR